jgi:uncharacterized membrane protein
MEEIRMLKFIGRNTFTGLVTILPAVFTLYLINWLAVSVESELGNMILLVLPATLYWPGMGLIAGLVLLFVVGLMMHTYLAKLLLSKVEQLLYRVPLIKSVYRATRDFFDYFSPTAKKEFEQVVSVMIGNTGMQVIGFVTQAIPERLPEDFREKDSILVYLPLSYMIGGYAVLMPRSMVRPLSMSMEDALRFTMTAGVAGTTAPPVRGKS